MSIHCPRRIAMSCLFLILSSAVVAAEVTWPSSPTAVETGETGTGSLTNLTRAAMFYSDEAAFVAAAGGTTAIESFESFTATNDFSSFIIETDDFSIVTQPLSNLGIYDSELTGLHATDGEQFAGWVARPDDNDVTFTFAESTVTFGVMITDALDGGIAGAQLLVNTNGGDSAIVASGPQASGSEIFFGLIADAPFTQVTFTVTAMPNLGDGYGFDEVRYDPRDSDEDGISDFEDNCIFVSNASQRDTNDDGIGNVCDTDLNNDCIVNVADLGLLRSVFFCADSSQGCVDADFNGDNAVNVTDLGIMRAYFFLQPGPSGLPNSCL